MKILIVEDREEVRALWRRFAQPIASEVLEAEDLASAMELMRKIPPPDLVLLDLNLPDSKDRDTLNSIERFRALNPRCLVVVLTGIPDASLAELSIRCGADAFAEKADVATQTDLWRAVVRAITRPNANRKEPPFEKPLALLEMMSSLALGKLAV